jgi:hypothetical protein
MRRPRSIRLKLARKESQKIRLFRSRPRMASTDRGPGRSRTLPILREAISQSSTIKAIPPAVHRRL